MRAGLKAMDSNLRICLKRLTLIAQPYQTLAFVCTTPKSLAKNFVGKNFMIWKDRFLNGLKSLKSLFRFRSNPELKSKFSPELLRDVSTRARQPGHLFSRKKILFAFLWPIHGHKESKGGGFKNGPGSSYRSSKRSESRLKPFLLMMQIEFWRARDKAVVSLDPKLACLELPGDSCVSALFCERTPLRLLDRQCWQAFPY